MRAKILLLDNYRQSLVIMRSLGGAGYRIVLGQEAGTDQRYLARSRHAHEVWDHPPFAEQERFAAALRALLAGDPQLRIIFPVGEQALAPLVALREQLAARVIMPPAEALETCLDKPRSYALARELGLPVPAGGIAHDRAAFEALAAQLGLPLAVKPCRTLDDAFDAKCVLVERDADRAALAARWPAGEHPVIVQQRVVGRRRNAMFVAAHGQLTAYFEGQVLRTDCVDGTGYGVEVVAARPSPHLRAHVASLAQRLRYDGPGCAQFLVDDEAGGDYYFLELNPRLDATCALAVSCGVDLPRIAVEPPTAGSPVALGGYPVGRRTQWLFGDLVGALHARLGGRVDTAAATRWVGRTALAFARSPRHMTWAWRDPWPTLVAYAQLGSDLVGGALRRARGATAGEARPERAQPRRRVTKARPSSSPQSSSAELPGRPGPAWQSQPPPA